MRLGATLATIVIVFGVHVDAAASPSAKLVYVRGAGTETCPPEADLRKAVAVRLGYDPFFPSAQKTVVAEIARAPAGYRGKVRIVADDGTVRGERELSTKGDDCGELTSAIALAVSIALDDLDEPGPKEPPAAESTPPPPPPPEEPPPPPPSAASPAPRETPSPKPAPPAMDFALSLGPSISFGTAPGPSPGLGLAAMLRWTRVALRLDLRGELPADRAIDATGRVATNIALALPSFCFRFGLPFACAGMGPGIVWSRTSEITRPASDQAFILLAAGRFGLDVPLGTRLYIEPAFDIGANLIPHEVKVDGVTVYEMSPVWGTLGLHLGGKIL